MASSTPDEVASLYEDDASTKEKTQGDPGNPPQPKGVAPDATGGAKKASGRQRRAQQPTEPAASSSSSSLPPHSAKRRRMLQTGDFQREISIQIGIPAGGDGAPGPHGDAPAAGGGRGDGDLFFQDGVKAALDDVGLDYDDDDDGDDDSPSQPSLGDLSLTLTGDSLPPTSDFSPGISDLSGLSGHDLHSSEIDAQTDPGSSEADTIYYNTSSDGEGEDATPVAGAVDGVTVQEASDVANPLPRQPSARRHLDFAKVDDTSLRRATRAVARGRDMEALRTPFDAED